MGWLTTWGPAIVAAVVSFVMATGFTLWFNSHNERRHRAGVRVLVVQEVLHNVGALVFIIGRIRGVQGGGSKRAALKTLLTGAEAPRWERTRWNLPDVGVTFNAKELDQLGHWYFELAYVAAVYEWQLATTRMLDLQSLSDETTSDILLSFEKFAERVAKLTDEVPEFVYAYQDRWLTDFRLSGERTGEGVDRGESA